MKFKTLNLRGTEIRNVFDSVSTSMTFTLF